MIFPGQTQIRKTRIDEQIFVYPFALPRYALEPESGLQLDYATGQPARGPTEVRIGNNRPIIEKANRLKIQLVEDVKEIGP